MIPIPPGFFRPTSGFEYVPAHRVYATRRVNPGWAGSLLRVRRSSDNAEQDIGSSGSLLDTAAMMSFVGSDSAYVTKWYDQSGNGSNWTMAQGANGSQPRIVNAGTMESYNSQPAINCITNTWLEEISWHWDGPNVDFTHIWCSECGVGEGRTTAGTWAWYVYPPSDFVYVTVQGNGTSNSVPITCSVSDSMAIRTLTVDQTVNVEFTEEYKEGGSSLGSTTFSNWGVRYDSTGIMVGRCNDTFSGGKITEFHAFQSILSTTDQAKITDAMTVLYGV